VSSGLLERWTCHHQRVSEREVRLSGTTVRPMLRDDVVAAADAVRRGDWGDREAFFRFAAAHSNCRPILAERDGEIVGTGVATVSGRVGWVGTIWVAPALRGRGLGRAITEAVIDELEGSGCRTLVLVATDAGRRVYERLGFEILTHDHALVAPAITPWSRLDSEPDGPSPRRIPPFEPSPVSRISMQSPRSTHGRPARTDATSWRRAMAGSSLEPLAR